MLILTAMNIYKTISIISLFILGQLLAANLILAAQNLSIAKSTETIPDHFINGPASSINNATEGSVKEVAVTMPIIKNKPT